MTAVGLDLSLGRLRPEAAVNLLVICPSREDHVKLREVCSSLSWNLHEAGTYHEALERTPYAGYTAAARLWKQGPESSGVAARGPGSGRAAFHWKLLPFRGQANSSAISGGSAARGDRWCSQPVPIYESPGKWPII
jgi:hypothetical protein